jgi:hypothetical protein
MTPQRFPERVGEHEVGVPRLGCDGGGCTKKVFAAHLVQPALGGGWGLRGAPTSFVAYGVPGLSVDSAGDCRTAQASPRFWC